MDRQRKMATFRHSSKVGPSLMVFPALMLAIAAKVVLCHVTIGVPPRDLGIALGYLIIGLISAAVMFWIHRFRITVDETGLRMSFPWVRPSGFRWDEINLWFLEKKWLNQGRTIHFQVRGRRRSLNIHENMVARPGVELFLQEVRTRIGDKERNRALASG
jgi:hypothetical protein